MTYLLAATILIVGSLLYIAWEVRHAPDRSRLPGNLARDHTWAEVEAWEQHVQSTPGIADWVAFEADVEGSA